LAVVVFVVDRLFEGLVALHEAAVVGVTHVGHRGLMVAFCAWWCSSFG
jgi:hypothetical protein